MKKKRMNLKKAEKRWEREDEVLDLKELMDVEGGIENNEGLRACELGCFNNASTEIEPNEGKTEEHEG